MARDALERWKVGRKLKLADLDPAARPCAGSSRERDDARLDELAVEIDRLQDLLYANSGSAARPRLLLVLQGMDTSGKDGTARSGDVTLGLRPERLILVSCNPESLARELTLATGAGYRVRLVQPVDMFPHTPHIEAVAVLESPGRPREAERPSGRGREGRFREGERRERPGGRHRPESGRSEAPRVPGRDGRQGRRTGAADRKERPDGSRRDSRGRREGPRDRQRPAKRR